jgi:hypothetical protein
VVATDAGLAVVEILDPEQLQGAPHPRLDRTATSDF